MIFPRLSAGAISLMYVGPAGRAIPCPMPTIARPAIKPPMLRGVNVEMKVEIMTTTHPVIIAHRRPKRSEIGAEKNTPTKNEPMNISERFIYSPAMMPPTL